MKLTRNGLELIKHFEGLFLEAYRDPVGIWTIGYGHTATAKKGMKVTEKQAEKLLKDDLKDAERAVKTLVTSALTDGQHSALVSFTFNLGAGNLSASTLLKRVNDGDMAGAADEFPKWRLAGGKVLPGLVRRRKSERHLFLTGAFKDFADGVPEISASAAGAPGTPSGDVVLADDDDYLTDFETFVAGLNLKNFKPYELLVMGDKHGNPASAAFGLNGYPPRDLWQQVAPTIRMLDKLRLTLGAPIRTISVYRSPAYNQAIGGATHSQHMKFTAIDFVVQSNSSPSDWASTLRQFRQAGLFSGGIGTYKTFVHIDSRGTDADWNG